MGAVAGVRLGGAGGETVAGVVGEVSASIPESPEADREAATRCNAFPSLRSLVIRFSRWRRADGRVMCSNAASISAASSRRSWERASAALLALPFEVGA